MGQSTGDASMKRPKCKNELCGCPVIRTHLVGKEGIRTTIDDEYCHGCRHDQNHAIIANLAREAGRKS